MPVFDEHAQRSATGENADQRRERVQERGLKMLTFEVARQRIAIAGDGQQMEE